MLMRTDPFRDLDIKIAGSEETDETSAINA